MADLAGQMFVRLVEVGNDIEGVEAASEVVAYSYAAFAEPTDTTDAFYDRTAFLRLPFEEALAFWRDRGGDEETLRKVLRAWREKSPAYDQLVFDTISRRAIDKIDATLRDGGSLRDFQQLMRDEQAALGIEPTTPGYLEMVYRTNVQSAYGAGRYTQMSDPLVMNVRPYRQWRTSQDIRVRDEHKEMNGKIWRADNPEFANVATPGGFNCRCQTISLSQSDLDAYTSSGQGVYITSLSEVPLFASKGIQQGFGSRSFG